MLYRKNGGPPRVLPAIDYDAEGQPWSDLVNNPQGRAATGWEPAPEPPAYDAERERLRWDEVVEEWVVEAAPIEPRRGAMLAAIDAERDRRQQLDFAWDFGETVALDDAGGPAAAGVRLLQMKFEPDQRNWLARQSQAVVAVLMQTPEAVMPMRAEDNWNVQTTAEDVLTVTAAMVQRNAALLFHGGALKSAVRAATSHAELDAVDLVDGWPA